MATNDDIADALTRHQIYLQRFGNSTVRKILALLKESDAKVLERLMRDDLTTASRKRQERLLVEMRRIIDSAFKDATGALQIELEGLAVYEGEYQLDLFRRVLPVKLETVTPAANQILAAVNSRPFQGKLLKDVYSELNDSAFRKVRNTIRNGFFEGRTTDQVVRDLRGTRAQGYRDGVLEGNRRSVEAVVRTAVNHTANTAREYTYESNDDLVKGVRWNATLDGRTSAVCRARDGKVYETGKGPRPPAHFNCRSSTSPVLKSWRDLGFDVDELPASTRASMNGQVPADQDYDSWLRKQSKEFQDDVLGAEKAEIFRSGSKLDRFVDSKGREYSLTELRKREKLGVAAKKKTKPPNKKREKLEYSKFGGIKSVAEAESFIREKGISAAANLKGVSVKGLNSLLAAALEVKERFNLEPLEYIGPFSRDTRHKYPKMANANAAVSPGTKAMHIPLKFGDLNEAERQIEAKNRQSVGYEAKRSVELRANTGIPDEVRQRVEKMSSGDYTWSITTQNGSSERAKTIFHEYGHVLHLIDKTAGVRIEAFLQKQRPVQKGWALLVSKYAGTNKYEYVAETFAIYMTKPRSEHFRIHPDLLSIYRSLDLEYDA
ncbi:MAG: minor capsid protein [Thalassovita sp.]